MFQILASFAAVAPADMVQKTGSRAGYPLTYCPNVSCGLSCSYISW